MSLCVYENSILLFDSLVMRRTSHESNESRIELSAKKIEELMPPMTPPTDRQRRPYERQNCMHRIITESYVLKNISVSDKKTSEFFF